MASVWLRMTTRGNWRKRGSRVEEEDDDEEEDDKEGSEVEDEAESSQTIASRGSILVTLRNVEPYTSW